MQKVIYIIFLTFSQGWSDEIWLNQVQGRVDQQAMIWFKQILKKDLPQIEQADPNQSIPYPCNNCFFSGGLTAMEPNVFIFMSFSVPEQTWLKLAKELEKTSGIFVVRGIPNGSFQDFAERMIQLKNQGMNVDVQINPKLFKKFNIQQVPTFVVRSNQSQKKEFLRFSLQPGQDDFDTVIGNISLESALEITHNQADHLSAAQ